MLNNKYILRIFIILLFLAGMVFYIYTPIIREGLTTNNGQLRCPNLLIQKDAKYQLYNTNIAEVPGVNPVTFNTLEEYNEFLEWQRSAGIRCPVLYLQNTFDAQGKQVYKVRPNTSNLLGGLPPTTNVPPPVKFTKLVDATRDDKPYNQNSYPAYDQSSFYVGINTPLDTLHYSQENMLFSDNAMDPNWGGSKYTQSLVDSGYYKNEPKQ